jgi:hypothetical protein
MLKVQEGQSLIRGSLVLKLWAPERDLRDGNQLEGGRLVWLFRREVEEKRLHFGTVLKHTQKAVEAIPDA